MSLATDHPDAGLLALETAPAASRALPGPQAPLPARQEALCFACQGDVLAGVLHHPATGATASGVGVVVVVGGPQYRVGSHRQFVLLARALAQQGHAVLRFDVRGMGDSGGTQRSFDQLSPDISSAVAALRDCLPGLRRTVLWGLCDGASAALMYVGQRSRAPVDGLVLLNPWVRSEISLARTHVKHYYLQRLRQPAFWRKLLGGGVARQALAGLWGNLRAAAAADGPTGDFRDAMAHGWFGFRGPILLVMSGADLTAREFDGALREQAAWRGALQHPQLRRADHASADHTFSTIAHRHWMEAVCAEWLQASWPPPAETAPPARHAGRGP